MPRTTSFADLGIAATVVLLLGGAPVAPPAESLAGRVASLVAAEWRVEPVELRLEWGRDGAPADTGTPFTMAGSGSGGWYAVVLDPGGAARAVRVRVGCAETVMVAALPLARGHRVAPGDLRPEMRVRWGPPDAGVATRAAEGWEVRRPLAANEVVEWPAAAPPALVSGGAPVRLVWKRPGVLVSLNGIALNSARHGDPVRARVEGQRQRLRGTAIAQGVVELTDGGAQ
jgi:flagella basal body P-ring formation protein FlgA